MSTVKRWLQSKKISLGIIPSLAIIILASLITTFAMFYIAPESFRNFWNNVQNNPALFFLNYFPILLSMILVYFISLNAVLSASLCSALFVSLSIINRVKLVMRQDPLLPTDVSLITEITSLLDKFDSSFTGTIWAATIIIFMVVAVSLLFFRGKGLSIRARTVGVISCVVIGFISNYFVFSRNLIYDTFPVEGNIYFKVNQYISKGFLYSFILDANNLKVFPPSGYHVGDYKLIENGDGEQSTFNGKKKPNILMIMGEGYSDLSENQNLDFSGTEDPMENFKEISKEQNAFSGHIIVPNFGGGTSDTEFDVLTACLTRFIENSSPSYNYVRKAFDALPRRLEALGYDAIAVHPGDEWFYNRKNVYSYMGFQDFLYLSKNFNMETQGKVGFISDAALTDTLIKQMDHHMETRDNPFFIFSVTIQNHAPYKDKYPTEPVEFGSKIPLSDEEYNLLSNYFRGVVDADKEIKRITDYYRDSEEPLILVYFGDHLPGFTNGMDFFDILDYNINIEGTVEQRLNVYKTPVFIWMNDSARGTKSVKKALKNAGMPENNTISANFLAPMVLDAAGFQNVSPLYDYSLELVKKLPIVTLQSFMTDDGTYYEELPDNLAKEVNFLRGWVFYKVFDEVLR